MSGEAPSPGAAVPESYPPARHVLRDLGIRVAGGPGGTRAALPLGDALLAATGGVRIGVVATLVDVVAGGFAIEAVTPDWVATSDLVVHRLAPASEGELVAEPRLARSGRRTVVLEVRVHAGDREVALATVGFSRLEARGSFQRSSREGSGEVSFATPGSGLRAPICDVLDVRHDATGSTMAVTSYVGNSLGAVQGGVVALLFDAAVEHAGRTALARPVACDDLAIHFVGLGRVGPLRVDTRVVRRDAEHALVRASLHDTGAEDRLCALATATLRAG